MLSVCILSHGCILKKKQGFTPVSTALPSQSYGGANWISIIKNTHKLNPEGTISVIVDNFRFRKKMATMFTTGS